LSANNWFCGEQVVVFDNLSQGHRAAVHPGARFIQGDLADRVVLREVFRENGFDAVMHFASNTLVADSIAHPFKYLGDNITNGLNILQEALDGGVRRFILSSTANLFDRPEHMPIGEEERIAPGSPYGESKYLLERILHWLTLPQGCGTQHFAT
jgi:UDP-glucose 4-epimerase